MKLLARFRRHRFIRLQFFMRSGHAFIVDRVKEFEIEATGNRVTKLRLEQHIDETGSRLFVPSIDLSQIEAVVSLPR